MSSEELHESRVSRLFFGGLSSAVGLVATHPLDVIKISIQAEPWKIKEVMRYYYYYKKGIYGGIVGAMARSLVSCNIKFELYEEAKRRNLLGSPERKIGMAGLSGALGSLCVTPMSKVHIRTQTDNILPLEDRRYYRNLYDGLRRIYRAGGIKKLYTGAAVSSLRGMMNSIGQIALYDETKTYLKKYYPHIFGDNHATFFISSVWAGCMATLMQQPFEVVQTKMMTAIPGKYKNARETAEHIIKQFGMRGFFKGLLPGFMRIVPQTVITYAIFEYLRKNYGKLIRVKNKKEKEEEIEKVREEEDNEVAINKLSKIV